MKIKLISAILAVLILAAMTGCEAPTDASATPAESAESATTAPAATPELSAPVVSGTPAETSEAPTGTEALPPTPTPPPAPLTVSERKLVYSNEHINVNIAYPEIAGMEDMLVQGNVNTQVHYYLQDKADEIEAQSEDDDDYGPHGTYFIETRYEVKRNDGVILSILLNTTYYEGGANTGSDVDLINIINTNPAQQPRLEELFIEGADYAGELNGRINALIAADPYGADYNFTDVSAACGYYLTNTDLVIVFERYTIAPGASGEPEFEIPLADLAVILIPGIA